MVIPAGDAGDARPAREGFFGDHFAKRAKGAGDDDGFSVHGGLRISNRFLSTMIRRISFAMQGHFAARYAT